MQCHLVRKAGIFLFDLQTGNDSWIGAVWSALVPASLVAVARAETLSLLSVFLRRGIFGCPKATEGLRCVVFAVVPHTVSSSAVRWVSAWVTCAVAAETVLHGTRGVDELGVRC